MPPEFLDKWSFILQDVEKSKIPVQFIKKIVIKMTGKKQHTINIKSFIKQGLEPDEIEELINRKLTELDDMIHTVEFILNIESIAEVVQPETDKLLKIS